MMSLEIDNSYQLFFEWTVILVCYFIMIAKLIIALKRRKYGAAKVQLLLLLIATVIVAGIFYSYP